MVRTLPAALQTAVSSGAYSPDVKVELADIWPHFSFVANPGGNGPCAAAIAPDGSLVFAVHSIPGTALYSARVTDPSQAGQWTALASRSTNARAQAGVSLCVSGGTVRLLWQANASTAVLYSDSADNGATWSAAATLFDPGKACVGIAAGADLTRVFIAYLPSGTNARVALWTNSGGWTGADWTNGDLNTITGIAAVGAPGGGANHYLALTLQTATGEAYSVQSATYLAGAWSALALVMPVDTSAGVVVQYPHLAQFDGLYQLSWMVQDTGSVSGVAYTRVARSASADFVHWAAGLEDSQSFPYGAAWVRHSTAYVLCGDVAARRAAVYGGAGAGQYVDMSGDLVKLELAEREGHPARLTLTLDNSAGTYTGLAPLLPDAQVLLSQGAVGAGLVATHLLYIDEYTYVRAADVHQLVLVASDRSAFLERQVRTPLVYANQSIGYIAADLAARAGIPYVAVDGATQFQVILAGFVVHAGETYQVALHRLLGLFDGTYKVELTATAGPAFGVSEQLHIWDRASHAGVVWTYASEPEHLHVTHSGDRANHIVVYGPSAVGTAFADSWDFADVNTVGQERFALAVEPFLVNATVAGSRAALELAREQRLSLAVAATLQPNPALELLDVVQVNDVVGNVGTRVTGLHTTLYPHQAHHDLVLEGEGV